jgi:hypothetical protein
LFAYSIAIDGLLSMRAEPKNLVTATGYDALLPADYSQAPEDQALLCEGENCCNKGAVLASKPNNLLAANLAIPLQLLRAARESRGMLNRCSHFSEDATSSD